MLVQLFKDGKEILGSDGFMQIDGRLNLQSTKEKVIERNTKYAKNFPHKIATSFRVYAKGCGLGGRLGRETVL